MSFPQDAGMAQMHYICRALSWTLSKYGDKRLEIDHKRHTHPKPYRLGAGLKIEHTMNKKNVRTPKLLLPVFRVYLR